MGSVIYQETPDAGPMRLRRKHWNMRHTKIAVFIFYLLAIPAYIIIGLQPSSVSVAETLAAESENASGFLMINSIGLSTPVADIELRDRTLVAPEYIAGSFSEHEHKTLLIGHSSTIFERLDEVQLSDVIDYNEHSYRVTNIEVQAKEKISMNNILSAAEKDTLILMTCTGKSIGANDYSHRIIITAEVI